MKVGFCFTNEVNVQKAIFTETPGAFSRTYFIIWVNYLSTKLKLRNERVTAVVCWRFTRHTIGGRQDNIFVLQ